ncbi:hypothetical protein L9F63_009825, partial [Diploptera punctata]
MTKNERLQKIDKMLRPLHMICKFAGFLLLSKKITDEKRPHSKRIFTIVFSKIYTFIIIFISFTTLIYIFFYILRNSGNNVRIDDIHLFQIPLTVSAAILNLLICAVKLQNTTRRLLHRMAVLDDLLKMPDITYKNNGRRIIILLIIVTCIHIALTTSDLFHSTSDILNMLYTIVVDFSLFILFLDAAQYITFIFLIKERFQMVNSYIMSTIVTNSISRKPTYEELGIIKTNKSACNILLSNDFTEKYFSFPIKTHNFTLNIRKNEISYKQNKKLHFHILRVAYESLYNTCSMINGLFGFQILLFTMIIFTEITSNLYHFIVRVLSWNAHSDLVLITNTILPFIWSSWYFIMLLIITGTCNSASEEANGSSGLLHSLLLIPELNFDTSMEIKLFIQQLQNRKLVGSIVGTVLTLLVISVQFHKI